MLRATGVRTGVNAITNKAKRDKYLFFHLISKAIYIGIKARQDLWQKNDKITIKKHIAFDSLFLLFCIKAKPKMAKAIPIICLIFDQDEKKIQFMKNTNIPNG